ncbi:hypothetical protein [Roseobacter sp. HKCCA0434]|uniref:hypothetical protein n=1 Tax=Roseobacter sp. HKCCA0434 TaxID=3079297 RepID=UPI002905828E|nr:hypothetical protein [Roseobacter sp. HKCCA0434]
MPFRVHKLPDWAVAGLAAAGLVGLGVALLRWRPGALDLPGATRAPKLPDFRSATSIRRELREAAAEVSPGNVTDSVGRGLIIAGVLLALVRGIDTIDEAAD